MGFSRQEYWSGVPLPSPIALTRRTFVGKVMSLLLNMLSRLVITFLPRSKCLLTSWLQSPSAVILEPPKIKFCYMIVILPCIIFVVIFTLTTVFPIKYITHNLILHSQKSCSTLEFHSTILKITPYCLVLFTNSFFFANLFSHKNSELLKNKNIEYVYHYS